MQLQLKQLPDNLKGPNDLDYKGQVPRRARYLHPEVADALVKLEADTGGLVYTDIYRSPDGSLAACSSKRGCQPPGFSPHNFGLAVDLDLGAVLRKLHTNYAALVDTLGVHGWYCHRRDLDDSASEAWHFNYLGSNYLQYLSLAYSNDHDTWSLPVEKRIQELYGSQFSFDAVTAQGYLAKCGFYHGEMDGIIGPLSHEAIKAFQRAWVNIKYPDQASGQLDPRTKRVLAVVTAEKNITIPLTNLVG